MLLTPTSKNRPVMNPSMFLKQPGHTYDEPTMQSGLNTLFNGGRLRGSPKYNTKLAYVDKTPLQYEHASDLYDSSIMSK